MSKRERLTAEQREGRDAIVEKVVALLKFDLTPLRRPIEIEGGEADELRDAVRLYLGMP